MSCFCTCIKAQWRWRNCQYGINGGASQSSLQWQLQRIKSRNTIPHPRGTGGVAAQGTLVIAVLPATIDIGMGKSYPDPKVSPEEVVNDALQAVIDSVEKFTL